MTSNLGDIVREGEGETLHILGGDVVRFLATGADTGGAFAALETTVPPQGGPPLHVHHREDEYFYVIDGEFEFQVGHERVTLRTGDYLVARRGTRHTFRNVGRQPGKLYIVVQPAGFEKFLAEFATLDPHTAPDFAKMGEIAARYGIEFVQS